MPLGRTTILNIYTFYKTNILEGNQVRNMLEEYRGKGKEKERKGKKFL